MAAQTLSSGVQIIRHERPLHLQLLRATCWGRANIAFQAAQILERLRMGRDPFTESKLGEVTALSVPHSSAIGASSSWEELATGMVVL